MVTSGSFNYINVLSKAADASWLRNETIVNNLANVDTPGYKRKDVDFESVLKQELGNNKYGVLDNRIANADLSNLNAKAFVDHSNYSYREDKNNVDVDTENVELASEKIRYTAIADSMTYEFKRLEAVIK